MTPFTPTFKDLKSVVIILAACRLPSELALLILDYAHYWKEGEFRSTTPFVFVDEHWSLDYSATYPYLCMPLIMDDDRQDEPLNIREITFDIVSHDQEWTTEPTKETYETSSWFEVSIFRSKEVGSRVRASPYIRTTRLFEGIDARKETAENITAASRIMFPDNSFELLRRPSSTMEPKRLHCTEVAEVSSEGVKEGEYSWYLQGNEVARWLGRSQSLKER